MTAVRWRRGTVEVDSRSRAGWAAPAVRARAAPITVPPSLFGSLRFSPALSAAHACAEIDAAV